MRLKKLLAGFMGAAMLAASLPNLATAALPAGYRFYEGFEDKTFIQQSEISGCNRLWGFSEVTGDKYWHATWKNEAGADGKNGYLEYERNNSATYNRSALNFAAYKLYDGNTPFEVGYKFKPKSTLTCGYRSIFTVSPAVGDTKGSSPAITYDTANGFILGGDTKTAIKNVTDWVSVRVVMNPFDKTVTTYMEYNGKEVSKTVSSSSSPHGFWMSLDCAWDNPKDTNKDVLMLDEVYAKALPVRTVTFETNDGSAVTPVKTLGDTITLPKAPTKEGYVFDGWYKNEGLTQAFDGTGVPEDGITVYAKWLKEYTVTYNTDTTDVTIPNGKAVEGTGTTELPSLVDLVRTGYQFDGWYFDKDKWENEFTGENITEDIEVHAKWITAHEIQFLAAEADADSDKLIKRYAVTSLKEEEIPTPVRIGWQFDGYFLMDGDNVTDERFTTETVVTGVTQAQAKWTKEWAVDFETGTGSKVDRIYTLKNVDVAAVETPTKLGGGFEGWYTDAELTTPWDGTVTGDITVYAKWNNIVKQVDFESETDKTLAEAMLLAMAKNNSNTYASLVEDGFGLVDDGTGNKAFKLPFNTNGGSADISFTNAGEGLYEISYKLIKNYGNSWIQDIMSPVENGTKLVTAKDVDGFSVGNTHIMPSGTFDGYRDVVYKVDTVNNIVSTNVTAYDINGNPITAEKKSIALETAAATGINSVRIHSGSARSTDPECYVDDIIIRKIEPPKVSEITFSGKAANLESDELVRDVALNPEIKVTFSEKMDMSTIISDSIYLTDAAGEKIASKLSVANEGVRTVATISPTNTLTNDTEYSLNIAMAIDNGEYMLEKPYKIDFLTVPRKFQQEVTVTDGDGNSLQTLAGLKVGEQIKATVKLRNYAGQATENYFVSVALKNMNNNQLLGYKSAAGTVTKGGELEVVLDTAITLKSNLTDNCKIQVFIWDGLTTRNSLWETITLP